MLPGRAWGPPGQLVARLATPCRLFTPFDLKMLETPDHFSRKDTERHHLLETYFGDHKFLFRHPAETGIEGGIVPSPS